MSKKKKYFILLSILFVLATLTAGIYLFVNPKINGSTTYTVDKYSDVTNWCDTDLKDGKLTVDCKALLINIDTNSCFEVQVITKDKELKDLTVCEKNDTLTYTNDVLGYKKLMPVDMIFTYTKEGILGDYSFNNVSFTKVDDTYVQSIVNEDIANLVTIDPSTTTIENSVDFCPRPETLPSYVTEANRTAYTEYFNKNIMAKEKYFDGYMYNWDDSTIRILFACDSAENMGYTDVCDKTKVQGLDKLSTNISSIAVIPEWGKTKEDKDKKLLKEISLIYDKLYLKNTQNNNVINLAVFSDLQNTINSNTNLDEQIFCNLSSIYKELEPKGDIFRINRDYILNILKINISRITEPSCFNVLKEDSNYVSNSGAFIKTSYSRNISDISSICNNISQYIKNE